MLCTETDRRLLFVPALVSHNTLYVGWAHSVQRCATAEASVRYITPVFTLVLVLLVSTAHCVSTIVVNVLIIQCNELWYSNVVDVTTGIMETVLVFLRGYNYNPYPDKQNNKALLCLTCIIHY